ncbi:MAG: hypothetical protein HGA37_00520 [Lentimicrobium sp.]|nr:hypothetical protein [Lentimicrobium sp.]
MLPLILLIFIPLVAAVALLAMGDKHKAMIAAASITLSAAISSFIAVKALQGSGFEYTYNGGQVFGDVRLAVDPLSAWFILLMNFTVITAVFYGRSYMRAYKGMNADLNLHWIGFLVNHSAMLGIYMVHNSLAFLVVWEVMAISAFLLVIFEHWKVETLKAGINYLIQSHVSIVFLMIGFLWIAGVQGTYDFSAITAYSRQATPAAGVLLFVLFFIGFGIKAGFVPFHTWLPYAHPAAPAHISGMMSGVIIKTGIYGILRIILLENTNFLIIGSIVLLVSIISGLYGVMLAIVQHNLKKLLAYHSIENIGIIGMGIGLGVIGVGLGNPLLAFAGFAGGLLHVLNHSLFKSLLFYGSGNIYQAIHSLNIDSMGGLIKQMPRTAALFLIAALAICGLPPFNGFVSEFLIYLGLFEAIQTGQFEFTALIILSTLGLVLIGGLAILCFTKAFGIIFLGTARSEHKHIPQEADTGKLLPMYLVVALIIAIGLFPGIFIEFLRLPVQQFTGDVFVSGAHPAIISTIQNVTRATWGFLLLVAAIWYVRKWITASATTASGPTWGCGYKTSDARLQYTASSFVRNYRKLVEPMLSVTKHKTIIKGIVPEKGHSSTHVYDLLESAIIDRPIRRIKGFIGKFNFLQNGSVQFYVLYGVIFIFIIITFPLVVEAVVFLFELIKQL